MGNAERNSFVKDAIVNATVMLLKSRRLEEISISEIISEAGVSRNSFYRNFGTKEEVLKTHVRSLFRAWDEAYKAAGQDSNAALYGSLFGFLKEHGEFFLLLKKRGLFYLFHEAYLDLFGPKPELENMWAYTVSFIACGTLGWIEEWIGRGMQESADTMTEMLMKHGMQ